MPEWNRKPDIDLKSVLDVVVRDLEDQVSDSPPFPEVAGLEMSELAKNAAEAVAGYQQAMGETSLNDPMAAMQIYCMGFVIGKKYGESRSNASPS
jgi:hypothetical protein